MNKRDGAKAPKIKASDIDDGITSKEGAYYADLLVRTTDEYIENADGIWDQLNDLLDQVFVGRVVLNIRPANCMEIAEWRYCLYPGEDSE